MLEWAANHSGVDEAVIRAWLRDVAAYLELPGCRPAVQEVVRPALLADPAWVLVGHSLGAVVCAELLTEAEVRARAGLFVAVGAPLGLDAVTDGMRPRGSARPTSPWVNVYDPRDWVALGSPLPRGGGGLRQQLAVANPRSYEHSIEHYLAHSPSRHDHRRRPRRRELIPGRADPPNPRTPANDATNTDRCALGGREPPTCCLQDSSGSSTGYWPVSSLQLRSDALSSQCAPVRPRSARWNDRQNDHLSKQSGRRELQRCLAELHPDRPRMFLDCWYALAGTLEQDSTGVRWLTLCG
jgi:hypothetical protein